MIYSINGQKFDSDFLEHHGILGQKWGVRRFQNKDGSYTEAGKQRRQEQSPKAKELTNELARKLERGGFAKSASDAKSGIQTARIQLKKDTDKYVSLSLLYTDFRVIEEDEKRHSYFVHDKKTPSFALLVRDGSNLDIATFGREGLIKQGLAEKCMRKIMSAYR